MHSSTLLIKEYQEKQHNIFLEKLIIWSCHPCHIIAANPYPIISYSAIPLLLRSQSLLSLFPLHMSSSLVLSTTGKQFSFDTSWEFTIAKTSFALMVNNSIYRIQSNRTAALYSFIVFAFHPHSLSYQIWARFSFSLPVPPCDSLLLPGSPKHTSAALEIVTSPWTAAESLTWITKQVCSPVHWPWH